MLIAEFEVAFEVTQRRVLDETELALPVVEVKAKVSLSHELFVLDSCSRNGNGC